MIRKKDLKDIANKRFLDAKALLFGRRYQGCLYIGGYTIELLLKYNVCKIFKFSNGFPESKKEFEGYKGKIKKTFSRVTSIRDFKTHDLATLLIYSGKELDVKTKALNEWLILLNWNPENRYLNVKINKLDAESFMNSVNKVKNILLN